MFQRCSKRNINNFKYPRSKSLKELADSTFKSLWNCSQHPFERIHSFLPFILGATGRSMTSCIYTGYQTHVTSHGLGYFCLWCWHTVIEGALILELSLESQYTMTYNILRFIPQFTRLQNFRAERYLRGYSFKLFMLQFKNNQVQENINGFLKPHS